MELSNAGLSLFVTRLLVLRILGPGFSQESDSQHLVSLILVAFFAERMHRTQEWQLRLIIAVEYLFSSPTPLAQ